MPKKKMKSLSLSLWMCVCLSLRDLSLSMFVYAPLVRYDTCLYGGATISRLLKVSFSKESYKRDCILQKRHVYSNELRHVPLYIKPVCLSLYLRVSLSLSMRSLSLCLCVCLTLIEISLSLSFSRRTCLFLYVHMRVCAHPMCACIYVFVYTDGRKGAKKSTHTHICGGTENGRVATFIELP